MCTFLVVVIGSATALALFSLGGGFYEVLVVDPVWPGRPELIQPSRGGLSRRRFWIPAHVAFELALLGSLALAWSQPDIRWWLFLAFASHATMRLWSGVDFIPKTLAFERSDPASITEHASRSWTHRSRWRLMLDLVACAAMVAAFATAVRVA